MGKVFTTRAHTRFTAATSRPFLIPTCAKRWCPSSGTIASHRALPSQRWARLSARTTPRTASSSIPTSSSAASRCPGSTMCGTSWTGCTTTIFISTIPSITSRTPAIPGSINKSPVATFTSAPVRVPGRTAGPPTASLKFSPARGSATRSTTGARRAATTGRTGNTRCANTSRSFSESDFPGGLERTSSGEAEVFELVVTFFDDLVSVNPDVALAGEHVDVGFRFPVGVSLAAVGIAESDVDTGEFFILKQNTDHLGQAQVGAESEFADPVAVFVGVAVIPEFLLQILAGAGDADEPRTLDL